LSTTPRTEAVTANTEKKVKHVKGGVVVNGVFHQTGLFAPRQGASPLTKATDDNQSARRRVKQRIKDEHEARARNERWSARKTEQEDSQLLEKLAAENLTRVEVLTRDVVRQKQTSDKLFEVEDFDRYATSNEKLKKSPERTFGNSPAPQS
jgi:hypothetical protein